MATSPIVREATTTDLTTLLECQDDEEVNQISFSSDWMAVCNDSGTIRMTRHWKRNINHDNHQNDDENDDAFLYCLEHDEENLAMVTCCLFRPESLLLASGGTDCVLSLWNGLEESEPQLVTSIPIPRHDDGNTIYNPPMIHSMVWSPNGRFLVMGLGDGTIVQFHVDENDAISSSSTQRFAGHDRSVASVLFPYPDSITRHHMLHPQALRQNV